MNKEVKKTEEEWRQELTEAEYEVLRKKGTEAPFSGKLYRNKDDGMYHCKACGAELFSSDTKFESGTGWPSFYDVVSKGHIRLQPDTSHGMERTEVVCARCGSHLGHLFDDGPEDKGGKRYCINSVALDFKAKDKK